LAVIVSKCPASIIHFSSCRYKKKKKKTEKEEKPLLLTVKSLELQVFALPLFFFCNNFYQMLIVAHYFDYLL